MPHHDEFLDAAVERRSGTKLIATFDAPIVGFEWKGWFFEVELHGGKKEWILADGRRVVVR